MKDKTADVVPQGAEITDDTMKDVNGQNKEEITDKTSDHKNGEKKNVEPATDVKANENVEATEMEIERNEVSADNESGTVQANANGEQEVPSEATTPTGNYNISVKSPTIHENDSDDSEDNDEPLSLSEIPTSQLDTTVGNSSEQENEDVDEHSKGNTMVDEGKDIEDTLSKSKKKKRLGTTGLVKNMKSKKPKKSPKKDTIVKMKKGGKEKIPDNNTFAKLRSKMVNKKEDTNEDSSHGTEGESDEENTVK